VLYRLLLTDHLLCVGETVAADQFVEHLTIRSPGGAPSAGVDEQ
jgi:hypothetical protein